MPVEVALLGEDLAAEVAGGLLVDLQVQVHLLDVTVQRARLGQDLAAPLEQQRTISNAMKLGAENEVDIQRTRFVDKFKGVLPILFFCSLHRIR